VTERVSGPSDVAPPRVVLYGRAGCHLCDLARDTVQQVCGQTGTPWDEVDVDTVPELVARYGDLVPVVTIDGRHHGHWRIPERELREALAAG
jgi:glutaredoxin